MGRLMRFAAGDDARMPPSSPNLWIRGGARETGLNQVGAIATCVLVLVCGAGVAKGQMLLHSPSDGQALTILPSDLSVLEATEERKDLPCSLTAQKPELGFDLRFHAGYEVTVPLRELS